MQHEISANWVVAKGGCYQCTNPNDVIVFDCDIVGEGVLCICTACILDAAQLARAGRARIAKINKAAEAKDAAQKAKNAPKPPPRIHREKVSA
jgi:hypothetical protein